MATPPSAAVESYNGLLAAASAMIRRLRSTPSSAPTHEVKVFQSAWNATRGIVAAELTNLVQDQTGSDKDGYQFDGRGAKIVNEGLVVDGRYGPGTAFALAYTLLAHTTPGNQVVPPPELIVTLPTNASGVPVWAARNQDQIAAMLVPIEVEEVQQPSPVTPIPPTQIPTPPPAPAPAPAPAPRPSIPAMLPSITAEDLVRQATEVAPPATQPADPVDFSEDEVAPIKAVNKGTSSNVPILVFGVGVLVFGGVVLYARRRKS